MAEKPQKFPASNRQGFTLIELVMIIVLIGILAATAYVKWPTGMKEEAAAREFKRAFRYAQHKAMTREYDETMTIEPWGIVVGGNRYTIQRKEADCEETGADKDEPDQCAEEDYRNRALNNDSSITISGPDAVWFNGLGEPIDANTGDPLSAAILPFSIQSDGGGTNLAVCLVTGYIQTGGTCP